METGSKQAATNIKGIGTASGDASLSVNDLRRALTFIGTGAAIKGVIDMADSYTQLKNRVGLVTKSTQETRDVLKSLNEVANDSRTDFAQTAELYARLALSSRELKLNSSQLLEVTSTLNKATILSGASFRESALSLIQLSQGIASGTLRGDELRSVLEQLPYVADLIAKHMGITRDALQSLASQGKVTSDIVIGTLLNAGKEVKDQFKETTPTISQAFVVLQNGFLAFIGELNESTGIFSRIAKFLITISEHADTLARVVGTLLVTAFALGTAAVYTFTAALLANPITFWITAITALVAGFILFSDKIKLSSDGVVTLQDYLIALWDTGVQTAMAIGKFFVDNWDLIKLSAKITFESIWDFIKDFAGNTAAIIDGIVGAFVGMARVLEGAFANGAIGIEAIYKSLANILIGIAESISNAFVTTINALVNNPVARKLGLSKLEEVKLKRVDLSPDAKKGMVNLVDEFNKGADSVNFAENFLDKQLPEIAAGIAKFFNNDPTITNALKSLQDRARKVATDRLNTGKDSAALDAAKKARADADAALNLKSKRVIEIGITNQGLKDEAEALKGTAVERQHNNDILKIRQDLQRKGIDLTNEEAEALFGLNLRLVEQAKIRASVYDSIKGPAIESQQQQLALNQLMKEGVITSKEYETAMIAARLKELESRRDLTAGFERGFLKIQDQITNFASLSEQVVTDAFSGMEDAIVNFVKTGKLSFSDLVSSVLADLTRLLFRMAISGLFSSLGGGGGILGSLFGMGANAAGTPKANGGPVTAGTSYLVGERGPEIYTPSNSGTITPNGAGGQQAVNVQVVNVSDPNEVRSQMQENATQDQIINVVRRNRVAVKQALGIS